MKYSEKTFQQLVEENAIMAEIGRIISSTLNIEEVYERFAEEVKKLISFDRISINTVNPDRRSITYRYTSGIEIPERSAGQTVPLLLGSGTEECIRTKSPLLISTEDLDEISKRYPRLLPSFKVGFRSILFIPLISRNEVIGVLSFRSKKVNAFNESDLSIARRVGNQIAGAIANAKLFIEQKKIEEQLRKSSEETKRLAYENSIIAEIGRIISSTLDIDTVYERFAEEVKKLIPFDRISISIINREEKTTYLTYVAGFEVPERPYKKAIPLAGTFTEEIMKTRKGQIIQGDKNEISKRFPGLSYALKAGLQSMLSVPLISKDEVIGVLHLRSTKQNAFTERDLELAERVGNQIAGAIANAQLFNERIQAERKAKALEEQLRHSQKMEAVGRLAGGIAHDFNNLLTVIKGFSELSLITLKEGDPLREYMEEIKRASQRAADLTRQLLAFSRRQILEFKVLDLNSILKEMDKMLHRIIGEDIELIYLLDDDLGKVKSDPGQIEQMILNLVVNARDAMPSGGKITIETANVELDERTPHDFSGMKPGPYIMLSMRDTGYGMSSEVKEHLFEPFFTTKEIGKGTGLGLATVYGIVKQSGGEIFVNSEPHQGTTFKIYLPRVYEEPNVSLDKDIQKSSFYGTETILLVEDEPSVKHFASQVLREHGYHLLESANGMEALRMAKEYNDEIHLLLTDVVMPQMGGKELVDRIKPLRPNIKVLFTSGYTENAIVHHGILEPNIYLLKKPFSPTTLMEKVREILDK